MSAPQTTHVRPQLTLDELHQVRWLLGGLLTVVSVATVVYMAVDAWILMGLTVAVSVLTTFRPSLPARMPRLVHLLAFPVIAATFAFDLWLRSELLPAMVRLDMLLLLYRALAYRRKRDDLQVIVLGLFLVVVTGVLTVSLAFAGQILFFTACALLLLLLITLTEGAGTAAASAPGGQAVPAWAQRPAWGRLLRRVASVLDWRVVLLCVGLFGVLVAGSALLFLLIPRFQLDNGMFLDRFISKKARTGFSDTIRFGDVTQIQQDTSVALHVVVADKGQIPLSPYWRMLVLDEYRDGTFRLSPRLRARRFDRARTGTTVYSMRSAARGTWTLYLESGVSRYLPLLGAFHQLRFAESQTYQHSGMLGLLALTKDPVALTAYRVEGFSLSARLRDNPEGFYAARRPEEGGLAAADTVRLQRLLAEAGVSPDEPAPEFAAKVSAALRQRHSYSLSPRIPDGGGDALVRWADSQEAGHCELFAGAFVLLARAAGHPARIVTGFRGGTWNAFSDSFTIRNSDAHAWAEIYDVRAGSWLRADPLELPQEARDAGNAAEALAQRTDRSWTARLESLRVFWYRRVISFDDRAQAQTLKVAKELAQDGVQRVRDQLGRGAAAFKAWWRSPWKIGRILWLAGALTAAAALTWGWRRLRVWLLQWWSERRPNRRDDPVRREAGRWLRRFGQREGVAIAVPPELELDLQRLRFAARPTWPDPGPVFRRAARCARARRE